MNMGFLSRELGFNVVQAARGGGFDIDCVCTRSHVRRGGRRVDAQLPNASEVVGAESEGVLIYLLLMESRR